MAKRQTIIRAPRNEDNPYFSMARQTAQDVRLSFEARGVLAYLLSKPNDWELNVKDLQKQGGWGRDKTHKIIKNLIDCGYLQAEQTRIPTEQGDSRYGPNTYRVVENPQLTPFQLTGSQSTGNPLHTYNREEQNTDSTKRDSAGAPLAASAGAIEEPKADATAAGEPALPVEPVRKATPARPKREKVVFPAAVINPIKDKIVELFGWDWETMSPQEKGQVQKAAHSWLSGKGTLDELTPTFRYCESRYDDTITPLVLPGNKQRAAQARSRSATPPPAHPVGGEDLHGDSSAFMLFDEHGQYIGTDRTAA